MMELPEILTLTRQVAELLAGKTVLEAYPPTNLHKFAFFHGDPAAYPAMLRGRTITGIEGAGMFLDIGFSGGLTLSLGDGVNLRYGGKDARVPDKYQLLVTFTDDSFIVLTVAMYGMIYLYEGVLDNEYHVKSFTRVSPLSDAFDRAYFDSLIAAEKPTLSVKALLASGQRIPGLGNGVLQDILFNAGIHPKRKLGTLAEEEREKLFRSVGETLRAMTDAGGRDTENDMQGNPGGYRTLLSAKTYKDPCPVCGGTIIREPYMGGNVYYCPACQPPTK